MKTRDLAAAFFVGLLFSSIVGTAIVRKIVERAEASAESRCIGIIGTGGKP